MTDHQRLWIAAAIVVMLLAASAAVAFGQDETADKPVPRGDKDNNNGGGAFIWLQTLGALAIVVALIFGARYVLQKLGRLPKGSLRPGVFTVLARTPVSAKHHIVLVQMGRRLLVVGLGGESMTTLTEITDADEIDEMLHAAGAKTDTPEEDAQQESDE